MEDLLEKPKEKGPYFHLSLDNQQVSDLMHPLLGFYKVPTVAWYGAGYPFGDMLGIVKANMSQVNLPREVTGLIPTGQTTFYTHPPPNKTEWEPRPVHLPLMSSIKFFWVVSDVSELLVRVSHK